MSEIVETIFWFAFMSLVAVGMAAVLALDPWHGIASFGLWMACRAYVVARRASRPIPAEQKDAA